MNDLPDVEIHNLRLAWRVWQILRAIDWKWTIADVLEQPEALLDDVMAIQFAYNRRKEQRQT